VLDHETMQCALVDSALDFDTKPGRTATTSADRLFEDGDRFAIGGQI
jgi:hypothetical protein